MNNQSGKTLIHNPALGCFLISTFIKDYQEKTAKTSHPSFGKILLILPIVWHAPSTKAIARRNFSTQLSSVIDEEPLLLDRLAERIAAYTPITGQSLNLGCASGLLKPSGNNEKCFEFNSTQWPHGSKPHDQLQPEVLGTISRLANWFKDYNSNQLYVTLNLI